MENIYFVLLTWTLITGIVGKECSQRTHNIIGNREIRLFNEKATYDQAKSKCRIWGRKWHSGDTGRLATIKNAGDQQCIQKMISLPSNFQEEDWLDSSIFAPGYLVGATDVENEGKWMWEDGTQLDSYTNWAFFELNASGKVNEDCMQLMLTNTTYSGYTSGKWIDVPCTSRRFYICERELDPSLNWGYENNVHAISPSRWHELYPECAASGQSPIDVTFSGNTPLCDPNHRFVKGWRAASNAQWIVQNTGRFIKITPRTSNSLWMTFLGSPEKFFVDHLILKWGEERSYGSEHSLGGVKLSGELQVFHKRNQQSGILHAFAIMLEERAHQENTYWNDLLRSISRVQETNLIDKLPIHGSGIKTLLRDSSPRRRVSFRDVLRNAIRYQGSLPHPPCTGNVLWTVFSRPVQLSFAQFRVLRSARSEDGITPLSNNIRPLQKNRSKICKVAQLS